MASEETPERPLPPFVNTDAEHERWEMCEKAAETMDPEGSTEDHWYLARSLYHSDLPTEDP